MDRLNNKLDKNGELMNYMTALRKLPKRFKKVLNIKKMVKKPGDIMEMPNPHLKECLKECKMTKRQYSEITADNFPELKRDRNPLINKKQTDTQPHHGEPAEH